MQHWGKGILGVVLAAALASAQAAVDHALLVGCNEYPNRPSRNELRGCVNDVALIKDRLVQVLGFDEEHIRVLAGWPQATEDRPTRRNILGALARLAEDAGSGDRIVVFLAGHGSQQPDGRDRDEDDGFDEVFLPADTGGTVRRRGKKVIENAITDDEIYGAIQRILGKGATVWLLSDSCHSATLARGDRRARGIDLDEFGIAPADATAGAMTRGARARQRPDRVEGAGFVAMYAVQADEEAMEAHIELGGDAAAQAHGIFTWSLARAITQTGGDATFDELLRLVTAGYRELGYHDITPFVQGDRTTPLRSKGVPRGAGLLARVDEGRIAIDGGLLHGIYPGSRLAVRSADRTKVLGEVRVSAAAALRSSGEPIGDGWWKHLDPHDRRPVDVLETPTGGRALRVAIEGGTAPAWFDRLRRLDPSSTRVALVDDPARADWVVSGEAPTWTLSPASGRRKYSVDASSAAETLLRLHRVSMLLQLPARSMSAAWPEGLSVSVAVGGKPLENGAALRPGTAPVLSAVNRSSTAVDLWAFWVDADHGVTQVFPHPDDPVATAHLVPSEKTRDLNYKVTPRTVPLDVPDVSQGTEHFVFFAVPPGTPSLGFLQTESLIPSTRGAIEGAAASMLHELAFGPGAAAGDGVRAGYEKGLAAGTWVRSMSFELSWGEVRAPAAVPGKPISLVGMEVDAETARPDPWRLGDSAVVGDLDDVTVVADRAEAPGLVLFDFDAEIVPRDEIAEAIRQRAWGAELALSFDAATGRRIAFYDTDGALPRFDLIRVDDDGDGVADREHRCSDGVWRQRQDPAVPWLQVAAIDFYQLALEEQRAWELEQRALAAVRTLCCSDG